MLWTSVVSSGVKGGDESGDGAYCRWPGQGGVKGDSGYGEYCGRRGSWASFWRRAEIKADMERST